MNEQTESSRLCELRAKLNRTKEEQEEYNQLLHNIGSKLILEIEKQSKMREQEFMDALGLTKAITTIIDTIHSLKE